MRRDELLKADLLSEILLLGIGVAILVTFVMVVVASLASATAARHRSSDLPRQNGQTIEPGHLSTTDNGRVNYGFDWMGRRVPGRLSLIHEPMSWSLEVRIRRSEPDLTNVRSLLNEL